MTAKSFKRLKTWHIGLWMLQILLAGMFLMVGVYESHHAH